MDIDINKLAEELDLLRLRLLEQDKLTEKLRECYVKINVLLGTPITVPIDNSIKQKKAWGPDPNYKGSTITPESQINRDHQLSREF